MPLYFLFGKRGDLYSFPHSIRRYRPIVRLLSELAITGSRELRAKHLRSADVLQIPIESSGSDPSSVRLAFRRSNHREEVSLEDVVRCFTMLENKCGIIEVVAGL